MEARFTTDLVTKTLDDGEHWMLMEHLIFYSAKYSGYVVSPAGSITNLASIPQVVQSIFSKVGKHDKGSVIHDGGYGNTLLTLNGERIFAIKKFSDDLFLEGMLCNGVPSWKAHIMHSAVVAMGDPVGHPLFNALPGDSARIRVARPVLQMPIGLHSPTNTPSMILLR